MARLPTRANFIYTAPLCQRALRVKLSATFYFYDLETWGTDPKKDRIAQFAGVRTDLQLQVQSQAQTFYCQVSPDYLPDPGAVLITGITPQLCQQKGLTEWRFSQQIHLQLSQKETCVVGYNNIRFDDEMLRYTFFRNFIEPYGREWQHGNSRWDLLDVVRACYALRPEGIQWPKKEDGSPSFKLEDLTKANQIVHEQAHDATSDVYATIAIASLIKQAQPRLFDYLYQHRSKQALLGLIDTVSLTPLVHVSGMYPAHKGCISWIVPLAFHPTQKNAVICFDLQQDPTRWQHLSTEQIAELLYTAVKDLPADTVRPALKLVHLNKAPVLAPAKTLSAERATELAIDRASCLHHLEILRKDVILQQKLTQVYQAAPEFAAETVAEYALYQGFISSSDQALMAAIQQKTEQQLALEHPVFQDDRLNQLWFAFKARNLTHLLSHDELQKWRRYCTDRLHYGADKPARTSEEFVLAIENLIEAGQCNDQQLDLLKRLYQYYAQN